MTDIRSDALPPREARPADPLITLVVPCYRERDAITPFLETVDESLSGHRLEIVFINDGSPDDTLALMLSSAAQDDRIKVLNLSRNFGKEAALTAGIDHAEGDVVVPIDVDLQDPPSVILEFLELWRQGFDVVNGRRVDRSSDTVFKRSTSKLFYRLFNRISDQVIPHDVGDFRLMDRKVVNHLRRLPERSRFMKGLFAWIGFPTAYVDYERPERHRGETSFNFWKLWRLAVDGFVNFSSLPLRIWTYVGILVSAVAFLYGCLIIARTLIYGPDEPGYASLMTVVLFFGGVQLISLGVIGEYLVRLFVESKARPIYVLEGVYGADRSTNAVPDEPQR